jgi:hypothetical protein
MLDLLLFVSIIMLLVAGYSFLRNKLSPLETVRAVVDRKWTRDFGFDIPTGQSAFVSLLSSLGSSIGIGRKSPPLPYDDALATVGITDVYLVSFRTSGGRLDLAVPEQIYIDLENGDWGQLTHKGEEFREFVKEAVRPASASPLPDFIDRTKIIQPKPRNGGNDAQS